MSSEEERRQRYLSSPVEECSDPEFWMSLHHFDSDMEVRSSDDSGTANHYRSERMIGFINEDHEELMGTTEMYSPANPPVEAPHIGSSSDVVAPSGYADEIAGSKAKAIPPVGEVPKAKAKAVPPELLSGVSMSKAASLVSYQTVFNIDLSAIVNGAESLDVVLNSSQFAGTEMDYFKVQVVEFIRYLYEIRPLRRHFQMLLLVPHSNQWEEVAYDSTVIEVMNRFQIPRRLTPLYLRVRLNPGVTSTTCHLPYV